MAARVGERGDYEITVCVQDSGIGMTPEAVSRLFQPFEQVDAGIARRYGGSGLGLAISRQIVLAMGGDIKVDSEPGRGSRFSFTLRFPVAEAQSGNHLPLPAAAPVERLPLTILVVDEHPINREVAQAKLGRLGYPVDLACDGPEAIAAVAKRQYDVIFMDLQMPAMSGIETTLRIANSLAGKFLPSIIALTASMFEEDRAACWQAGMCDFLGKPLEFAQLDAVLSRVAMQRRAMSNQAAVKTLSAEALERLREIERLGEPQFVAKLCQLFLADTRKRLPRMIDALGRGAAPELEQEAHALRSASATVGATEMAALCDRIEQVTRQGRLSEVDAWIAALTMKFPEVEQSLAREIARPDGVETL